MPHLQHTAQHTEQRSATDARSTAAEDHRLALANHQSQATRCQTRGCDFNAKVGTAYCGFCHIHRGTYWNSSIRKTPQRLVAPAVEPSIASSPESEIAAAPQSAVDNPPSSIPPRMPLAEKCAGTTRSGTHCNFAARRATGLCINHDPAYRARQDEHRRHGARTSVESRRQPPIAWDELDFSNRTGVQAALETVVRLDLEGRLSSARTRTLVRSLALAARNFDAVSAANRRRGAVASHPTAAFDAARRRCAAALTAILPPAPQETP
jgi:hypothetical protein